MNKVCEVTKAKATPTEQNGKYVSPFIKGTEPREATIPAGPYWSEVKIRYIPLSADENSLLVSEFGLAERKGPASFVAIYAAKFAGTREVAGNLLSWDLKDDRGHRLMVTAENICGLHDSFFDVLYAYMLGKVPSGNPKDPEETEREAETKNS